MKYEIFRFPATPPDFYSKPPFFPVAAAFLGTAPGHAQSPGVPGVARVPRPGAPQPHVTCPASSRPSLLSAGCHLYATNTHHSRELRIVVAIRNKLLLITRKHSKLQAAAGTSLLSPLSESPVEEFQYIRVGLLFHPLLSRPGVHKATLSFHSESVIP